MQQKTPIMYILQQELEGLMKKLLLHFLKPEYVCALSPLSEVNLDDLDHYLFLEQSILARALTYSRKTMTM